MTAPVVIRDVKVITTQPGRDRLVVVKIIPSEPGLYGLGCATFTQRWRAVVAAVEGHVKPLVLGRDVARIEEMFRMAIVNGYWRNGPVLNNAISGVDMALWDIKGKMAGMPVYQLLGGKCREAAAVYTSADGASPQEVADNVGGFVQEGYHYVRAQMGGYGGRAEKLFQPENPPQGAYYDPRAYARNMLGMLEHVRTQIGDEVELLHDVHERLSPIDAVGFAKDVEKFKLFYLEDILAPEHIDWLANIRQVCATPLALGELFNNPQEWKIPIENRLIDFLRMHLSQLGGITPARDALLLAHHYGIRTAWHGPGDVSPVGHAANLHLDLWAPNFGIQEWCRFPPLVYEMFPGMPVVKNGHMYGNDRPGLGVDIDEKLAAKYPCTDIVEQWTQTRLPDGTPARP